MIQEGAMDLYNIIILILWLLKIPIKIVKWLFTQLTSVGVKSDRDLL